jgi:hypothetical protein
MEHEILTAREIRRYSKQIMIREIGITGQEKLKKCKVLVVGAGDWDVRYSSISLLPVQGK